MHRIRTGGPLLAALMIAAAPADAASRSKGFVILPTVFRVGAFGPPCTHATLNDALLDAVALGENIIRLADNQLYTGVNVNIASRDVTIEGGYADCAATSASGERTVLNGAPAAGDSVIEFVGGVSRRTLTLRNLEIQGGTADGDGGGGLQVNGEADVVLENVRFLNNVSTIGGAIRLFGTPTAPVELRVPLTEAGGAVLVVGNDASVRGGGMSCESAAVRVSGTLSVVGNRVVPTTAGDGGGLDLFDCDFQVGVLGPDSAQLNVGANSARFGGGIHLGGGTQMQLRGARHDVSGNAVLQGGGGLYLSDGGDPSNASISNLYMSSNQILAPAGVLPRGGAILVQGSTLRIAQVLEPCRTATSGPTLACNTIRNNVIDATATANSSSGGAVAVFGADASVTLAQAYIGLNRIISGAGDARGAALVAGSVDATLTVDLESVVLDRNTGTDEEIWIGAGVDAIIAYASFNFVPDAPAAIRTIEGAELELHANASLADTLIDASAGGSVAGDCNVLSPDDDSFASIAAHELSDVRDYTSGDLQPTSTAIQRDRCGTALFQPAYRDALNRVRPLDIAGVTNAAGPYDAGAYEAYPDELFADGFEQP